MAKQKEKIIPIEPKKLFWTMKQHVFHYLETHPLIRNPKELCFALPDYKTVTLYNYYKEWKNKKEYAISAFVSDIWVLLYLLGHKFTPTKQSSMAEEDSIQRLGELVEKFPEETIEERRKRGLVKDE